MLEEDLGQRGNRRKYPRFRLVAVVFGLACLIYLGCVHCLEPAEENCESKGSFTQDPEVDESNSQAPAMGESAKEKSQMSVKEASANLFETLPKEWFEATAYCLSGLTRSGVPSAPGLVAADPEILPLGSLIHVDDPLYRGVYQVLDTGELIKGKIIDIFLPSYEVAVEFGRRKVKVTVLRYGFFDKSAAEEKQGR